MNKAMLPGVVIAAGFIVAGGVYLAAPSLQSDRAIVDREVGEHVERARRLLDRVGANQERLAVVLKGLELAQVRDLDDERIDELVEEDRELLANAQDRLQDIYRRHSARRVDLADRMASAGGEPLEPPSARFGANVGQMAGAIRAGLAARDELLQQNEQLLEAALQAIQEAMAVQRGDWDGRTDPAVLRLQGMTHYVRGTAFHRQARWLRDRAHGPRRTLRAAAAELAKLAGEQQIVQRSEIDARIADAQADRQRYQAALDETQESIAGLEATISNMEPRLADQQALADEARQILDALADEGIDFADPQGFRKFSVQYTGQSQIYRQALRAAQVLEFGTLGNATIDSSGDFLTGAYLPADGASPIVPQRGLLHYRAELAELQTQASAMTETVAALDRKIEELQQAKARLVQQAADSADRAEALRVLAEQAYDALIASLDQAWEFEDRAIAGLNAAVRSFRSAAQHAQTRARDAGEAVAGLSPEAAEHSPEAAFAADDWPSAGNAGRAADAQLRLAIIYYDRFRDLTEDDQLVESLADLLEIDEDEEDFGELADQAREAGLAAAEEATEGLFRASRRLDQHYSLTAEIGSAYYLQALFGRRELVRTAIENFAAAVEGREDSPYVRQYLERLDQLRRRSEEQRK